jgi:hypothetical protein
VVLEHFFSLSSPEIATFVAISILAAPIHSAGSCFSMVEIYDKSGPAGAPIARPRIRRRIALEVAE